MQLLIAVAFLCLRFCALPPPLRQDVAKLDAFLGLDGSAATASGAIALTFDVDTALRVCVEAGYGRQALFLAQTHGRHDW